MAIKENITLYKIHPENQTHNKNKRAEVIGKGKRKDEA